MNGSRRLHDSICRLRAARNRHPPLKPDPSNPFEVSVAETLKAMQREIDHLRSRLDWLLVFIVGAALTNGVINLLQ